MLIEPKIFETLIFHPPIVVEQIFFKHQPIVENHRKLSEIVGNRQNFDGNQKIVGNRQTFSGNQKFVGILDFRRKSSFSSENVTSAENGNFREHFGLFISIVLAIFFFRQMQKQSQKLRNYLAFDFVFAFFFC